MTEPLSKDGHRFLASHQAHQYVALNQAAQYILSGSNSNLNIYLDFEALEKEGELKNLVRLALQKQALRSTDFIETNDSALRMQLSRLIESLRSSTDLIASETTKDLYWTTHRASAVSANIQPFWMRPKFQTWCLGNESSLRLIRGSHQSRHQVKTFCLDLIRLMREAGIPLIWILKPNNTDPENSGSSVEDLIKGLVFQVLSSQAFGVASQNAKAEHVARLCHKSRHFSSLTDCIDVLAMAIGLCQAREMCLIIDVHLLKQEAPMHETSYVGLINALWILQNNVKSHGCKTVLKTLLVSYGGAIFRGDEVLQFSDILIAVENSRINHSSGPAKRQRMVRQLLDRRTNVEESE